MPRRCGRLGITGGGLLLIAASAFAGTGFSLRPDAAYPRAAAIGPVSLAIAPATGNAPVETRPKKRPWLAAGETAVTDLGVWAYDRYVSKKPWAYISWATIKENFRQGFGYDNDPFFTNFFLHPYHGSLYFNTARSLGMNYWASTAYSFGGSLVWELFLETERPSIDDLILTTTAGAYGGEVLFRVSSLILDDSASGVARFWRELAGFILDPWRGMNRLICGDAWRIGSTNGQECQPLTGDLAVTAVFTSLRDGSSGVRRSGGIVLDLTYGQACHIESFRKPFDLIVVQGGLRSGVGQPYFNVDTYALLFGWDRRNERGQENIWGFFQDYDYLKNEEIEMGGTSFTAGVLSRFPLGSKLSLKTSLQAGAMAFGASNNPYTLIAGRDYNYGFGPLVKADAALSLGPYGTVSLAFRHYEIYTLEGAAHDTDESRDHLTIVKTSYGIPIWKSVGLRAEYAVFFRHTHFEGHPSINPSLSCLTISAFYVF